LKLAAWTQQTSPPDCSALGNFHLTRATNTTPSKQTPILTAQPYCQLIRPERLSLGSHTHLISPPTPDFLHKPRPDRAQWTVRQPPKPSQSSWPASHVPFEILTKPCIGDISQPLICLRISRIFRRDNGHGTIFHSAGWRVSFH